MQQKADAELWDEMSELQQQRQPLFAAIFPIADAESSNEIRTILETIIALNNKLEKQCEQQKQVVQLQLQGMNKNKKAVNAYQAT